MAAKNYRYPAEKMMIVLFPLITLGAFYTAILLLDIGQKTIFPTILKILNHH
jgi:hypothetical protein